MTASARTDVGHNRQTSLIDVNNNQMFDKESTQLFSDMDDDAKEEFYKQRDSANKRFRNTAPDLEESKEEHEIPVTE